MDKNNLYDALEELILERINTHHFDEPESVEQAYARLTEVTDELRETFTEGQRLIFTECEDAYCVYEGETINFYYRAGFSDAIRFLFGWTDSTQWRDGKWN
ncbi:MAG: hypothetical protein IJC71_04075 [Clostridia bacterium]|nr:hypothetical protein [Clostridia bacterium]